MKKNVAPMQKSSRDRKKLVAMDKITRDPEKLDAMHKMQSRWQNELFAMKKKYSRWKKVVSLQKSSPDRKICIRDEKKVDVMEENVFMM